MTSNPPSFALRPWQHEAIQRLRTRSRVAIIGPPGVGKSTAARWVLREVSADGPALMVVPSLHTAESALEFAGVHPARLATNKSLREPDWLARSPVTAVVATADVLATRTSAEQLAVHEWRSVVFDGVDEWPPDAQAHGVLLLSESDPDTVLLTSRTKKAVTGMSRNAEVVEAPREPTGTHIGVLRFQESRYEQRIQEQVEGLNAFAGDRAEQFGLDVVRRGARSSPYAAQQAALRELARLRPERNAIVHSSRAQSEAALLFLVVVQGLELLVRAVDHLESDSKQERLLRALAEELSSAPRAWILTSETATRDYLESAVDRDTGELHERPPSGSPPLVVVLDDHALDSWEPGQDDVIIHYDIPDARTLRQRASVAGWGRKSPPKQWALVATGDRVTRSALRRVENPGVDTSPHR